MQLGQTPWKCALQCPQAPQSPGMHCMMMNDARHVELNYANELADDASHVNRMMQTNMRTTRGMSNRVMSVDCLRDEHIHIRIGTGRHFERARR